MKKLFYSISEVAETIGESVSLVRFWSNSFPKLIKPSRTTKGNRQFTAADVETIKQLHFLVRNQGLTLEGAGKQLTADRAKVEKKVRALDSLREIRAQLAEIEEML